MNATTFNTLRAGAIACFAVLGLNACSDTGEREEGISIAVKATPLATAHTHGHDAADAAIAKHSEAAYATFRRSDGVRIDLQLGLLNLVPIELEACPSSAAARLLQVARQLSPIASAQAHAGHDGEAPEGAISVTQGEDTDLGTLIAAPGRYCALIVELQPGAAAKNIAKHGDELDASLAGASINVAPCYYPATVGLSDAEANAATAHACTQAKYTGEARRVRLPLMTPITLGADQRAADLTIAVRFEEWFEGVDFATLSGSATQQARVADNVAASLQLVSNAENLVNLAFKIEVGGQEAKCGGIYHGLGSTSQALSMQGFRFYASEFALENAAGSVPVTLATKPNGTVYQGADAGVVLLGHAQGCDSTVPVRNLALTGTAPAGEYERLCFTLGVPFELNHSDVATAPTPLNVTGLGWNWLYGRMFLRFDSLVAGGGDGGAHMEMATASVGSKHGEGGHEPEAEAETPELTQNFFVHLGSTGCNNGASEFGAAPDSECVYPNRSRICLSYPQIAAGHPIVADIAPVISELDITVNTADTAPGCMSFPGDPECTTIIPKLGLDFALSPDNLIPRREQALFTVGE
ncbi:MbnP family copper-binding protein [Hydrocarboniphaga effusa]|jgi:uncharacterized repeat protein (TIGR04052 family)|uniref:MbnP family copper-binding protein n=1 Tax=Hydrocarboniphaga effusa TaxID=243629 RepID=UPI003137B09A